MHIFKYAMNAMLTAKGNNPSPRVIIALLTNMILILCTSAEQGFQELLHNAGLASFNRQNYKL